MHVGKFYPPHMGGMETHLQALCRELGRSVDVRVLVASDDSRTTHERVDGVEVVRAGTVAEVASTPLCPGMTRAIRRAEADIVHFHLPNPAAMAAYLASGHRGPLVVTYHSDIVRQRVLGRLFQPLQRRFLRRASAIIASSPNYVASSEVLRAFRDRCRVIPFGIPLEPFGQADPAAVEEIRRRHGPRIVTSVGRLVYYKGFEFLIDAMRGVDARLLIVGEGPLRAELERKAARWGVQDRVVFLGEVPDVAPYYHAADLFAFAPVARSEAFGLVQLEAMASGLPVVNTALDSGVPFASLDGVTGLTVPPADPGALAAAINALLDDADRRARFGAAARERVRREFSLDVMTRRTMELYEEVAAGIGTAVPAIDPLDR